MALRAVWLAAIERQDYLFASIQATLWNAHFDTKGVPWTAEDFLGRGKRKERESASLADRIATSRIVAGARKVELPDWAREIERTRKLVN